MDDEKLIGMVRNYEFLYNLKHPKYMDTAKKDVAWKQIAEQLQQSAIACKQRWQCLRDAYRRALNKRKGKSEQALKAIKPWKYENEMAFVVPFFVERKTHDSIETSDDDMSEIVDDNTATNSTGLEMPCDSVDIEYYAPSNFCTLISDEVLKNESQSKKYAMQPKAVKRKAQPEPPASPKLMAKSQEDENRPEPTRAHDELDRFFLNISDTVKKFSPYTQAVAKNKIFSIVSDMELQHFAPSSSTPMESGHFECVSSDIKNECEDSDGS